VRMDELRVAHGTGNADDEVGHRDDVLSISDVTAFFKHYWPMIATTAAIFFVLAIIYISTATPIYTATAQLLVETNQTGTPTITMAESSVAIDTPQIESEIALLSSEQIVSRVAKQLDASGHLPQLKAGSKPEGAPDMAAENADKPASPVGGWLHRLLFGDPVPMKQDEKDRVLRQQVNAIQDSLSVKRVGLSYVLEMSYRATDPNAAATLVNALGDAYVQDKIDGRADAARRSSTWLEARIEEIRRLMNEAALDVQEFKAKRDYRLADRPAIPPPAGPFGLDLLPKTNDPSTAAGKRDAAPPPAKGDARTSLPEEAPTLEELDSRALTYRKIYESYLQAYTDTVQRQSYPNTSARVISRAEPPTRQSSPKRGLTLLGSLIIGSFVGIGIALIRASFDETLRSPNQLMRKAGVPLLSEIDNTRWVTRLPWIGKRLRGSGRRASSAFVAIKQPHSAAARQLISVAASIGNAAQARRLETIGIAGMDRSVDDASIASNVAMLNARAGKRTLLIEADTGHFSLTPLLAPSLAHDLKDVVDGAVTADAAVVSYAEEPALALLLLSKTESDEFWTPARIQRLRDTIEQLRGHFDRIFVHLPPAESGDMILTVVDGTVIVSELWQTKVSALQEIASRMRIAGRPLLGVVAAKFA
jgi:uncharacterized protein involved in exopolysaccharide biosynthesis/Mrp family chromosome partitioning ATPase